MARQNYLFTSESVSEGHPDKVCDRISDEVVDLFFGTALKEGMDTSQVRVACETLATTNRVVIAGMGGVARRPHRAHHLSSTISASTTSSSSNSTSASTLTWRCMPSQLKSATATGLAAIAWPLALLRLE